MKEIVMWIVIDQQYTIWLFVHFFDLDSAIKPGSLHQYLSFCEIFGIDLFHHVFSQGFCDKVRNKTPVL